MLTIAVFLPLVAMVIVLAIPSRLATLYKSVAVLGAVGSLVVTSLFTWDYMTKGAATGNAVARFESEQKAILAGIADKRYEERIAKSVKAATPDKALLDELKHKEGGAVLIRAHDEARELEVVLRSVAQTSGRGKDHPAKHIGYVEFARWIPIFRINYIMGVDGLSLPLVFLTALLGVLCLVYSWNIEEQTHKGGGKGYFALFLLLETGLMGVFCALDFFLFYVFWEIVLLPMYFLIGVWGGPRRIYAAIKFFIYTLVGSVLMLIAMLALFFKTDPHTFNMLSLAALAPGFDRAFQWWIFLALFFGFAIKVPVFPFHTWLPDAHVEAPTAVSVVLAGVLLKMGGYGFFRLSYPLAPAEAVNSFLLLIAVLGLINLVYGALVAMAQTDFKSLVAYSSISHMGYVLLGLAALTHAGAQGAAFQMFNHGVSSAMLFLLVGVVYERAHHRDLARFGGFAMKMPVYTGVALVGFFSSLGLPGLNGFWSEALVFLGCYQDDSFLRTGAAGSGSLTWIVYVALAGIVLTAAYILWTVQRVFLGTVREEHAGFKDLKFREAFALVPLAVLCLIVGIYPMSVLAGMDPSLTSLVEWLRDAHAGGRS